MFKKINVNGHVYKAELKMGSLVCFKTDYTARKGDSGTWGIVTNLRPYQYEDQAVEVMVIDPDNLTPIAGMNGSVKFDRAFFHNQFYYIFDSVADYLDYKAESDGGMLKDEYWYDSNLAKGDEEFPGMDDRYCSNCGNRLVRGSHNYNVGQHVDGCPYQDL